jgi:hydroxymethylpyrimidine pyrophosphatase-like HAD family hydrolase
MSEGHMHLTVVATDLDGTLARQGMVDPATWQALHEAKAAGLRLVLVTGRALHTFTPTDAYAEAFDAIVAENGAVVYFPRRDIVVIPFGQLDSQLIAAFERRSIPFERGLAIIATHVPHDVAVLDVIRSLSGGVTVEYNRGAVMVLPAGATKGTGLQYALREMGYSPRNAIAIGDAENDRSLFEVAEIAVAVANATPEVQALADRVLSEADGAGVRALLADLQHGTVANYHARLSRYLSLGQRLDGEQMQLDPFMFVDGNVGIVGSSGSGKSWLAGLIAETLLKAHYQLCVIDPEGDYRNLRAFPHTLLLGGPESALPPVSDVITMLEYADLTLVVDLSLYPATERDSYTAQLLEALHYLRTRRGRPHWVLVDEAQHFCAHEHPDVAAILHEAMRSGGIGVVSYAPSRVAASILQAVHTWFLTRLDQPDELHALMPFLNNDASLPPMQAQLSTLPIGQAMLCEAQQHLWLPCNDFGNQTLVFRSGPRTVPHIRHLHKYLRAPLSNQLRFYFRTGNGQPIQAVAASLWDFRMLLQSVSIDALHYHLQRGDFERWVRTVFRDAELAHRLAKLARRQLAGEQLRQALSKIVGDRYEELDSLI